MKFRKEKNNNDFSHFEDPIRAEFFSSSHLEKYAEILAVSHNVSMLPSKGVRLSERVGLNEDVLIKSFQLIVKAVKEEKSITPAAEWLIDNFYIVEEQLKDIRDHLPPEYYKELPKLVSGEFKGHPRVYAIAWYFVSHTDSLFNPEQLKMVIKSYQKIKPLTMGELWAISITLRVVMIENLRRLSVRIVGSLISRVEADHLGDELFGLGGIVRRSDEEIISELNKHTFKKSFAVQLIQRLRFQEGEAIEILKWLRDRLSAEGLNADHIVQEEHSDQTAANVTVRNTINSMRLMSSMDWREFFEEVSLVDDKFQENPIYCKLDFSTRDIYRHSLEELARGSKLTELEVATALVEKTANEQKQLNPSKNQKRSDLGFFLISRGRYEFEKEIYFKVKLRSFILRWYQRHREFLYIGSIFLLSLFFILLCLDNNIEGHSIWFYLIIFAGAFPASELAITIINRCTVYSLAPRHLPRLDLSKSISKDLKTFVVVPTMLINLDDIVMQVEQLEVHYLSNPDDSVYFALLSDWRDAASEQIASDEPLLMTAVKQINILNSKYGPSSIGKKRFYLFHRYRKWNKSEQKWIGWERKRGKLHEFNRHLRGSTNTSFILSDDLSLDVPKDIKYVITLDADTKLPRGAVEQLVGTLAHPLNQPIFDTKLNRVIEGYGILQPRITPSLPEESDRTFFQHLSSGPCGIDPYAAAVSDVYQDLFCEGSYTGKGIYNVDVFEQALKGRTPENRLLSHDLFEGNFARTGLLSDVEFFEDFPSNFEVAEARNHRWTRGDWQLLPWILGREGRGISIIGRWKMFDNLRRSLVAPADFFLLLSLLILPHVLVHRWAVLVFVSLSLPHLLPMFEDLINFQKKVPINLQLRSFGEDLFLGICKAILNIVFLPYHSWVQIDAICRTLFRLGFSKKKLLEWTTSAQSKSSIGIELQSFLKRMLGVELFLFVAILSLALFINTDHLALAIILFTLWLSSPFIAWRISCSPIKEKIVPLSDDDIFIFRNSARKIWRFFSTFVNEEENFLPPDNFQEDPYAIIAHRSSPTNFGLYLMSVVSARDFGWIGIHEMVERLEQSIECMRSLPRYNGHFYNWYETTDKHALEPRYISSVDNGNFAGHLLTIAQSCEEKAGETDYTYKMLSGVQDSLRLLVDAFSLQSDFLISSVLNDLVKLLLTPYHQVVDKAAHWEILLSRSAFLLDEIKFYGGRKHENENNEIHNWASLIESEIKSHARDYFQFNSTNSNANDIIKEKLRAIATKSRALVYEMDFSFLYDSTRKLFSIGYRLSDSKLDDSFYDLLASEARLLSLVAIAKGDVPVSHWFRLGRSLTSVGKGTALISWSGSMFEYLMPSLVMNTPVSSLIEKTCRIIIKKQILYANRYSIPWGMSESAYNARDLHLTYQYSNFGVPKLAFKRGIGKDLVIAPYATMLAGMYDPINAVKNLKRLTLLNAEGIYGYYESIDFTKSRIPEGSDLAVVKTYMAHHQGMSLISISNIIHDGLMVKRFHKEPIIQSCELLLQERSPRNVKVAKTRVESFKIEHVSENVENNYRQYFSPKHRVPRTHLLSNGNYSLMITAAGSGQSRFKELSVTRWREDVTRDHWGNYTFLRDIHSDEIWSAGYHPTCVEPDSYEVIFTEDRAKIYRQDKLISSLLEVFISPEDNAEIRRTSLTNNGPEVRVIEVTTYSEVVLNTQGADVAHPAFSNLFVQTEYRSDITALLASRRPRSATEEQLWMAHVVSTDSNAVGEIEYETDRARFIGRGNTIATPVAIGNKKLSNTVGPVLDPIVSLRSRVRIEPGTTATITHSTIIAPSKDEIIKLAEKFHEESSYERTSNLAWTDTQVKLHHLGIELGEANIFQQLANRIIFLDSSLRVSSEILKRNNRDITNLWAYGISGDNPILLVHIDDIEQRTLVRQILRAYEFWQTKCLKVDLVIINEKLSSYSQELQHMLESLLSASELTSKKSGQHPVGKVFLLRSDLLPKQDKDLLQAVARAILVGRQGNLSEQVKRMVRKIDTISANLNTQTSKADDFDTALIVPKLDLYNGFGGFAEKGLEYIIHLKKGECTPAPWINVIANPQFGFHVSERGAGSTWSMNSRENQLTPWSNDSVTDPTGECFYIFDRDTHELWSPTISPIRVENAEYLIRHGQGYSQFEIRHLGIHCTLTQFVHTTLPIKISKIVFKNELSTKRNFIISAYIEWVLGFSRTVTSTYILTEYDIKTKSLLAQNPLSQEFGKRIAFASFIGGNDSWTGSRTEFIGRNGNLSFPQGLHTNGNLSGNVGAGMDACAALKKNISIEANAEKTIVFLLGQTENLVSAQDLITDISGQDINEILNEVKKSWDNILRKIQVETPDVSMNIMLNHWLLYQTTACRLWARSALYQAGGAFGFRDQLQDSMALIWTSPEMIKSQIQRAASRQFIEGDVQHWWHMPSGRGVRTHFSDDLLWLPFVVSYYLHITEDHNLLNIEIPFLTGPILKIEQEDSYYTPEISSESATLYEHCARAIDHSLNTGEHGLPLMGGGDWNDGMNRVGHLGKGESVWLGWFLISNLSNFVKIAEGRGDNSRSEKWLGHMEKLKKSIEEKAWDGKWYRRAYYDDGLPLGSDTNSECKIDSLAQTWGIISRAADPLRVKEAMDSVEKYLIKSESKMILLFTPPFDKTLQDPGYIKGYIPGVRENGGQYTHAAIWCIQAFVGLENGKRAVELFSMLNPVNHSLTYDEAQTYKVEPYVIAADIYSEAPHTGRGGWTWYTGSSGWMYTTGIEAILGFKLTGNKLSINPCINPEWKSYKITYQYLKTFYEFEIKNPKGLSHGIGKIKSNDAGNELTFIELIDDGIHHQIIVELT